MKRIALAQDTEQWQAISNTVIRLMVPRNVYNLFATYAASQERMCYMC